MGGFARYPWPQYISNAPFYYNKLYKRVTAICIVSGLVNALWWHRYFSYHSVRQPSLSMSILATAATSTPNTHRPPAKSESSDYHPSIIILPAISFYSSS
jgi:hypothetical protein